MNDPELQQTEKVLPINLNEEMQYYLYETAKWGKFLSIVGFVFIALFLLAALAIGSISTSSPWGDMPGGTSILTGIYAAMAVIYFFPTLYLYKFSANTKQAINYGSEQQLTEALSNLKSVFKFWGIMTLVIIIFYTLILIAVAAGGVAYMTSMGHNA